MYQKNRPTSTTIERNTSQEGETIEAKVRRIVTLGEPIEDGAPLIYQESGEGVNPMMDPRTDRWELALDMQDEVQKAIAAASENVPVVNDKNNSKPGPALNDDNTEKSKDGSK